MTVATRIRPRSENIINEKPIVRTRGGPNETLEEYIAAQRNNAEFQADRAQQQMQEWREATANLLKRAEECKRTCYYGSGLVAAGVDARIQAGYYERAAAHMESVVTNWRYASENFNETGFNTAVKYGELAIRLEFEAFSIIESCPC
jgi:hypothetical protein